jgi:hypothetical protein
LLALFFRKSNKDKKKGLSTIKTTKEKLQSTLLMRRVERERERGIEDLMQSCQSWEM